MQTQAEPSGSAIALLADITTPTRFRAHHQPIGHFCHNLEQHIDGLDHFG
jgi:hypothetical protein